MRNRFLSVAIVFGIILPVALGAFAPAARGAMSRPTWSVGDYWEYAMTGESTISGFPVYPGDAAMRMEVLGLETLNLSGGLGLYAAYHAGLTLTITQGNLQIDIPGDIWFRTADLALAKYRISVTYSSPLGNQTITVTVTFDPPLEIRWPVSETNTWSPTSLMTLVQEITGQPNQTVSGTIRVQDLVEAPQDVTVPAGRFSTTPLRMTQITGDYSRQFWSSQAGNEASEKTYYSNGTQAGSRDLTSYRYQAAGPGGGGGGGNVLGLPPILWIVILIGVFVVVAVLLAVRPKRPTEATVPAPMPPQPVPPPSPP